MCTYAALRPSYMYIHTHRDRHTPHRSARVGVGCFAIIYLIPVSCLIGLRASESPVGIFKLGHGSDQSQNKQWLEENLQKSADLHYSHSQPQPPPSFPWKTPLLVPDQVFSPHPIIRALFFVIMWVLSIRQWHHKRHSGRRRNAFLFHKVYTIVPESLTYSMSYLYSFW